MLVSDLMKTDVRVCRADDTLDCAVAHMLDGACGCVPVVDPLGRPIAVVTDRDVAVASFREGLPLSQLLVAAAASEGVVVVRDDDTVAHAETVMAHERVRRLPVVDRSGRLVGILAASDLVRHACDAHATVGRPELWPTRVAALLADIYDRRRTPSRSGQPRVI